MKSAAGDREQHAGEVGNAVAALLAEQWRRLIGRLADRLGHELRNPLNGAMVNLQVVSSRAGRAGQDAAALEPFAVSAASELERAAKLMESLLAVIRSPRDGEGIAEVVRVLEPVYAAAAHRVGGTLKVGDIPEGARTRVDSVTIRIAVAAVFDAAIREGGSVTVDLHADGPTLHVLRGQGLAELDSGLQAVLARAGISCLQPSPTEYVLHFPALDAGDAD